MIQGRNLYAFGGAFLLLILFVCWCVAEGDRAAVASLVGGAATIFAGWLAWRSAIQVSETTLREAAINRLRQYSYTLDRSRWIYAKTVLPSATPSDLVEARKEYSQVFRSQIVSDATTDAALGRDSAAFSMVMGLMMVTAGNNRTSLTSMPIFAFVSAVSTAIKNRIVLLQNGTPIGDLARIEGVNVEQHVDRYERAQKADNVRL